MEPGRSKWFQGEAVGRSIQDSFDRRSCQTGIQSPARVKAHGGVNGGKSHAGGLAEGTMVMTDGDGAVGRID